MTVPNGEVICELDVLLKGLTPSALRRDRPQIGQLQVGFVADMRFKPTQDGKNDERQNCSGDGGCDLT